MKIENDENGISFHTRYSEIIIFIIFNIIYFLLWFGVIIIDIISVFSPMGIDFMRFFLYFIGITFLIVLCIAPSILRRDKK